MHDDLFVITHDLLRSLPSGMTGALGVLLISVLLAWIKWKAEEDQRSGSRRQVSVVLLCEMLRTGELEGSVRDVCVCCAGWIACHDAVVSSCFCPLPDGLSPSC